MATTDKILDRVRALLAIAEHPNTPEHEADTALNQANRLMAKHAIDEALARQAQTISDRRAVEQRSVKLNQNESFEFLPYMERILSSIAHANRVQMVRVFGLGAWQVDLFGMHEDVEWVENLYTRVYFQFVAKVNPRWDDRKSWDENVYNHKVAGWRWVDINDVSMQHGHDDMTVFVEAYRGGPMVPKGQFKSKIVNAYKRHAKKIGDDNPITTAQHSQYRRQFAEGFRDNIVIRMQRLWREQQEEADTIPGAALALRDMSQDIREAMWAAFPELSPEEVAKRRAAEEAARRKAEQEREDMLNAMSPKERYKFLQNEELKAERNYNAWMKSRPKDQRAAQLAGDRAANGVVLDRNAGATTASETKGELR